MYKVKTDTKPASLAGAIAHELREKDTVELQCVGAGAVNQAIKATIIARGYLKPTGTEIELNTSFGEVELNGEKRTAIKFLLEGKNGTE